MPALDFLVSSVFYGWQIALIVIVVLLIAGMIALNVLCALKFRIVSERKLFDNELQSQRDALEAKLESLYSGKPAPATETAAAADGTAASESNANAENAEKLMNIARNNSRYYKK